MDRMVIPLLPLPKQKEDSFINTTSPQNHWPSSMESINNGGHSTHTHIGESIFRNCHQEREVGHTLVVKDFGKQSFNGNEMTIFSAKSTRLGDIKNDNYQPAADQNWEKINIGHSAGLKQGGG